MNGAGSGGTYHRAMKFRTTIFQSDGNATGIVIPADVLEALGAGKKPPVKMSVNGYSYRSTVATVNGRPMVGFSAAHREASGLKGGDDVDVDIELDAAPRVIELPPDFAAALAAEPRAQATFDKLSNSVKGYHVSQVVGAKTDETRQRRIEKSIAVLRKGKPR
jgi:hypothetical protein